MAEKGDQDYYVTQTLSLGGVLPIKIKIYPETSKIDVDGIGLPLMSDPYFLDRDGSARWSYDDQNAFFTHYNNRLKTLGKPELTGDEFTNLVFTDLYKEIDKAAAVSLNNCDNYASTAMCNFQRERHFDNGIPGVKNPNTGATIQPDGNAPIAATEETVNPDDTNPNQPGDGTTPEENKPDYNPYSGTDPITDYAGTGDPWAVRDGAIRKDLRYPLKHASMYDFIQIFPMKYIPSMGSGGKVAGTDNLSYSASDYFSMVDERYKEEKAGSTIFLPMIPAGETTSTGWGGEEMNAIQKEFGIAASNMIGSAADSGSIQEWVKGAGGSLMEAANNLLNKERGLKQFITAYFAGKAVGANLLGRSGIAINPNLELLFSGPSLRTFRYNFRFTPREELEAKEIRDIIKVFKKGMAPRRTEGHMFLNVPNVWSIKYIHNSQNKELTEVHPYLNKIKTCALKTFNVEYMPDNSYMTYHQGGSMTSYQVTMEFGELEPIYNNDIKMNSNDMGY